MIQGIFAWFPAVIFFLIWLVVVVYLLSLASRLVQAVEQIAERLKT